MNTDCRIWDYEEAAVVNTFDNHNTPDKGVSKLCLLNELDDSLLLVASSKYCIEIQCVISFFQSFYSSPKDLKPLVELFESCTGLMD